METDNVAEPKKDALAEAMEAVTGDDDDENRPSENDCKYFGHNFSFLIYF